MLNTDHANKTEETEGALTVAPPGGTTDADESVEDRLARAVRQFADSPPVATGDIDASLVPLLAEAVRVSRSSIVVTDAELGRPGPTILWVNDAFERLTGYKRSEVVGRSPRLLQGPRTDRQVLTRLRHLLDAGEDFEGETINYRRDGTPFVMSWRTSAIRDDDGTVTHYVAIQDDVTSLRLRDDDQRAATLALQRALMPSLPAAVGPFALGHAYRPAAHQLVGGDWADVIDVSDSDRHLLVVGDVTGHGTAAVAAMGQLRWATQAAALAGLDSRGVLSTLRRLASLQDLVATVLLLSIDASGAIEYRCAGHPPALILATDGTIRFLSTTAPLIGPGIDAEGKTGHDMLGPGEWLVAYTDGLIERRRRNFDDGLALLQAQFRSLVRAGSDTSVPEPESVASALVRELTETEPGEDDIAVVVLRAPGQAPAVRSTTAG